MYFQGETLHFLATATSERALIVNTEVVMVQVIQDLGSLVQTGYRAVPYDPASEEMVVWAKDSNSFDGTVSLNLGDGPTDIQLMDSSDVFSSGTGFSNGVEDNVSPEFSLSSNEAGFRMLIHARAMPVNVDSMAQKIVQATIAVEYEALSTRRRRLLSANVDDFTTRTEVSVGAWKPGKLPIGLGVDTVSMSLSMSLPEAVVTRNSAPMLAKSIKDAFLNALNIDPELKSKKIYDEQVSIDTLRTDGIEIWRRPQYQGILRRRLASDKNSKIQVDFTFASSRRTGALSLPKMINIFKKQIVMPTSPLMTQEIFADAVVQELEEIETSDYEVRRPAPLPQSDDIVGDIEEESSAFLVAPWSALLAAIIACVH